MFLSMWRPPPCSARFPYTTLFRSGHHPPVQVHRDDAVRERGQDVVGVRLEIDELDDVPLQLGVRLLECPALRSEEHTSELQSHSDLVCRLLLEKKNNHNQTRATAD